MARSPPLPAPRALDRDRAGSTKRFPGVVALDEVSLTLRAGRRSTR